MRLKPQGQKQIKKPLNMQGKSRLTEQHTKAPRGPKDQKHQQPRSRICLIPIELLQMMMGAWIDLTHSQQIWDVSPVSFAVALQPESAQEHTLSAS